PGSDRFLCDAGGQRRHRRAEPHLRRHRGLRLRPVVGRPPLDPLVGRDLRLDAAWAVATRDTTDSVTDRGRAAARRGPDRRRVGLGFVALADRARTGVCKLRQTSRAATPSTRSGPAPSPTWGRCWGGTRQSRITSSALASTAGGIVRPRALAVLRLSASKNSVAC